MQSIIQDIRKQCRLAMNGVASTSMREKGVVYKINFGLIIQQIKNLAERYDQSSELAEALWKEDTRELKILATLLYPTNEFTPEIANRWAIEIPNQEIREQVCLNLFQELPFAKEVALEWSKNEQENIRTTGYWLLARLILAKKLATPLSSENFNSIWNDIISEQIFLRNAALLVLKHIGRQSKSQADSVMEKVSIYKNEENPLKKEAYDSLSFEFEFIFG